MYNQLSYLKWKGLVFSCTIQKIWIRKYIKKIWKFLLLGWSLYLHLITDYAIKMYGRLSHLLFFSFFLWGMDKSLRIRFWKFYDYWSHEYLSFAQGIRTATKNRALFIRIVSSYVIWIHHAINMVVVGRVTNISVKNNNKQHSAKLAVNITMYTNI